METLRALSVDDADQAGAVLARAFHDDPGTRLMFPDEAQRRDKAPGFFAANTRLALALGEGLASVDGFAVGLFLPPGAQIGPEVVASSGLEEVIAGLGPEASDRIGHFFGVLGELHTRCMPEPHWQLFLVGVDPAHQGHGLGAAIVDEMTVRARTSGTPGYLDTLTSGNVAFYERRGYQVVGEADGLGVPAWGLRID